MDEIEKYYQILGVESSDSFRTIKKKYTHLALKYHPRSTAYYFNNDKFIDIVLAFDLISKITKYNQDYGFKTKRKIYDEWVQKEKQFAEENARSYIKLKHEDFERIFFKGLNITKRFVYTIFLILASFALIYPILEYFEGRLSIFGVYIFSIYTFILVKVVFDAIHKERKSRRLIRSINNRKIKIYNFKENSE